MQLSDCISSYIRVFEYRINVLNGACDLTSPACSTRAIYLKTRQKQNEIYKITLLDDIITHLNAINNYINNYIIIFSD